MSNVSWFIDHSRLYLLASMIVNESGFGGTAKPEFLGLFPIVLHAKRSKVVLPLEECLYAVVHKIILISFPECVVSEYIESQPGCHLSW